VSSGPDGADWDRSAREFPWGETVLFMLVPNPSDKEALDGSLAEDSTCTDVTSRVLGEARSDSDSPEDSDLGDETNNDEDVA